jgi:hypothetical protein
MKKTYSQFLDVQSPEWRDRACGIVALGSMMAHWDVADAPSLDDLITIGVQNGAYLPGVGWKHQGIVELATRYGLAGKCFDWFAEDPWVAFLKFIELLGDGPVIASIHRDFDVKNGGHLVIVEDANGVVRYHDSAARERTDIERTASVGTFLVGWKRRAIAIRRS